MAYSYGGLRLPVAFIKEPAGPHRDLSVCNVPIFSLFISSAEVNVASFHKSPINVIMS
jgi:hypothetical protein